MTTEEWLDSVQWGAGGLVPAIAQEAGSGAVLTLAWMNREALAATASSGLAHYWSRSRQRPMASKFSNPNPNGSMRV